MSGGLIVYTPRDPEPLAAALERYAAELADWWDAVEAFVAEVAPGHRPAVSERQGRGAALLGISPSDDLPADWRVPQHGADVAVPRKRTKEQKALARRVQVWPRGPVHPLNEADGMPCEAWVGEIRWTTPGFHEIGGRYYVEWNAAAADELAKAVDESLWERVPLSAYYAAVEAAEAAVGLSQREQR